MSVIMIMIYFEYLRNYNLYNLIAFTQKKTAAVGFWTTSFFSDTFRYILGGFKEHYTYTIYVPWVDCCVWIGISRFGDER